MSLTEYHFKINSTDLYIIHLLPVELLLDGSDRFMSRENHKDGKRHFRARHTFLTAVHTVVSLSCSASPILYLKSFHLQRNAAQHTISLGCESMTTVGNVVDVRTYQVVNVDDGL